MTEKKLWGGRFREATDRLVEELNASVAFDQRLAREDVLGSVAHARMLAAVGVITVADRDAIVGGLRSVLDDIEEGRFTWRTDREDVHMNVEAALAERIGEPAGRLHTARSRNDQVALDVRLWLRRAILDVAEAATELQGSLIALARAGHGVLMPGYTHLQRAQPVTAAHHFLAYVEMLERDGDRLLDSFGRTNVLPLGSGALAATPFPIDREMVARDLRFDGITRNSLDGVSDRDFALEFCAVAAICQVHLSRLSEELVLWTSQEFGFIELPDAFCTGSSIMPQKKNPDIPELVRGKTGRVTGDLVALLTVMKGLPLAYNKDMQEDKEPLFDAADTVLACLTVTARMLERARLREDRMRAALAAGHLTATDLADALVERGMPFREAHHVVGSVVAACSDQGRSIESLGSAELAALTGIDDPSLVDALDPARSVARRDVLGGPAPGRVAAALDAAAARLEKRRGRIGELRDATSLDHLL
ncbi:MAG: argininosuccinate lyase [Myxococcales bacterium]